MHHRLNLTTILGVVLSVGVVSGCDSGGDSVPLEAVAPKSIPTGPPVVEKPANPNQAPESGPMGSSNVDMSKYGH